MITENLVLVLIAIAFIAGYWLGLEVQLQIFKQILRKELEKRNRG